MSNCNNSDNTITSASVYAIPNTIVSRDKYSSTWLSGIILKGVNYLAKNVDRNLTKNGYLYFYSHNCNKYAMLKNIYPDDNDIHLSFDIGKTKTDGKFSIRNIDNTVSPNVAKTLFTIINGKVAIGTDTPLDDFYVKGDSTFADDVNVFGDLKINGKLIYSPVIIGNPEQTDVVNFGIMEDYVAEQLESFTGGGGIGATGVAGTNGTIGATGVAGTNGTNGTIGATGVTGNAGSRGFTGSTGVIGATGVSGTNGTNGTNGTMGATGVIGATGVAGTIGATGAVGPASNLQGPAGPTGPEGPTGDPGAAGGQGNRGATGPQGNPGAEGVEGPSGPRGFIGATGPQGNPGAEGTPGPQNLDGLAADFASNLLTGSPNGTAMFYYDSTNKIIALRVTDSGGGQSYVKFQMTSV